MGAMRSPSLFRPATAALAPLALAPLALATLALATLAPATLAPATAVLAGAPAPAATTGPGTGPHPALAACSRPGFGGRIVTPSDPPSASPGPCPSAVPFGVPPGVTLVPAQTTELPGPVFYNGPRAGTGHGDGPSTLVLAGIGLTVLLGLGGAVSAWADRRQRAGLGQDPDQRARLRRDPDRDAWRR
jgi:hypothetical protein